MLAKSRNPRELEDIFRIAANFYSFSRLVHKEVPDKHYPDLFTFDTAFKKLAEGHKVMLDYYVTGQGGACRVRAWLVMVPETAVAGTPLENAAGIPVQTNRNMNRVLSKVLDQMFHNRALEGAGDYTFSEQTDQYELVEEPDLTVLEANVPHELARYFKIVPMPYKGRTIVEMSEEEREKKAAILKKARIEAISRKKAGQGTGSTGEGTGPVETDLNSENPSF